MKVVPTPVPSNCILLANSSASREFCENAEWDLDPEETLEI